MSYSQRAKLASIVMLLLATLSNPARADLQKALDALERGDHSTAFTEFSSLAENGDPMAQAHLGFMYYTGEGVAQDMKTAVTWYRKAARQGNRDAQYNLGVSYAFGEGVERNLLEANKWYQEAANQGHATAQYSLGLSYHYGEGMPQNYIHAAEWFQRSAEQGYPQAQVQLGSMYHLGQGVEQDYAKAAAWYEAAATRGDATAQYNLGSMYRQGQGVPQDYDKAYYWLTKARQNDYSTAAAALDSLRRMQPPLSDTMAREDIVIIPEQDSAIIPDAADSATEETTAITQPAEEAIAQESRTSERQNEYVVPAPDTVATDDAAAMVPEAMEAEVEAMVPAAMEEEAEAMVPAAMEAEAEAMVPEMMEAEAEAMVPQEDLAVMPDSADGTSEETIAMTQPASTTTQQSPTGKQQNEYVMPEPYDMIEEADSVAPDEAMALDEYSMVTPDATDSAIQETDTIAEQSRTSEQQNEYGASEPEMIEEETEAAVPEEESTGGFFGEMFSRMFGNDKEKKPATETNPTAEESLATETGLTSEDSQHTKESLVIAELEVLEQQDAKLDMAMQKITEGRHAEALDQLESLAKAGNASAQYELGKLYRDGLGVSQDNTLAAHWFALSSDRGNANAHQALSVMESLPEIDRIASPEDSGSADEYPGGGDPAYGNVPGTAIAAYNKAKMYSFGDGVAQDDEQAFEWYLISAKQHYPPAQYQVGNAYAYGQGIAPDQALATEWYEKAANNGYVLAQRSLGNRYLQGKGVEKNIVMAHAWYTVVANFGNPLDEKHQTQLSQKLNEQQLMESEQLVASILSRFKR